MHTYIRIRTYTRTHAYARTRTHVHVHTHMHVNPHARIRTHAYARTRTYAYARIPARTHARTRTHAHLHTHTHVYPHARIRTHAYARTRRYAYAPIPARTYTLLCVSMAQDVSARKEDGSGRSLSRLQGAVGGSGAHPCAMCRCLRACTTHTAVWTGRMPRRIKSCRQMPEASKSTSEAMAERINCGHYAANLNYTVVHITRFLDGSFSPFRMAPARG